MYTIVGFLSSAIILQDSTYAETNNKVVCTFDLFTPIMHI